MSGLEKSVTSARRLGGVAEYLSGLGATVYTGLEGVACADSGWARLRAERAAACVTAPDVRTIEHASCAAAKPTTEASIRTVADQPVQGGTSSFSRASWRLAWVTLSLNVVVILQGAFVRISGSGAGCGSHWPTCNGTVVPLDPSLETVIEFSHRLLSFAVLVLGVWLARRAMRTRRERPGLFAFASASLVFVVLEALIGAATVLLGLTGDNASVARGVWVASHLVNSLLLVGMLSATVVYAARAAPAYPLGLGRQGGVATVLLVAIVAALVLCFTGGIAAMGNTIFPSESLAQGIRADFDPDSHLLIRLRILHPLIAITVGVYLFVALGLSWYLKPVARARRLAQVLLGVYVVQLVVGTFNLAFLAPMVLQFLHLLLAVTAFALLASLTVTQLGGTVVRTNRFHTDGATLENA